METFATYVANMTSTRCIPIVNQLFMIVALLIRQETAVQMKTNQKYIKIKRMRREIRDTLLICLLSYRKLQNRQGYFRSPLSCTALRWPANVVWRLNVLPHISHVACCPWRRTCVWKFSLIVNSLPQTGHLVECKTIEMKNTANAKQNELYYFRLFGFLCPSMCSSMFVSDLIFFPQHFMYPFGSLCSLK